LLLACAVACSGGASRDGGATRNARPLANSARPSDPAPPQGAFGRTALHDAAQDGDLATMRTLLDEGADIEAIEDTYRYTPFLLALEYGEPEAAMLLLQRGASTVGYNGTHGLVLAARGGAVDVIDALLARGIVAKGSHALHAAAKYGHAAAIRRLLAAGEPVDEVERNDQWTPLTIACMENHLDAARVLIDAGASVNVHDDDGNMPLHWAVFGARPNEIHEYEDFGGEHDTYYEPQDDAPIVELLLAHGAPIDALDGDGDTALIRAAIYDAENAVEVLLTHGADRRVRNRDGKTALDIAQAGRNDAIAKRLR
jgi:ankyrin repeat protein